MGLILAVRAAQKRGGRGEDCRGAGGHTQDRRSARSSYYYCRPCPVLRHETAQGGPVAGGLRTKRASVPARARAQAQVHGCPSLQVPRRRLPLGLSLASRERSTVSRLSLSAGPIASLPARTPSRGYDTSHAYTPNTPLAPPARFASSIASITLATPVHRCA